MTNEELKAALALCADEDGRITKESVVAAAGNRRHPAYAVLHPLFTWDPETAAHKWRLEEAAKLIRSVTYIRHETTTRTITPFYVHTEVAPRGAGYTALPSVERASEEAAQILADELARCKGALSRATKVVSAVGWEPIAAQLQALLVTVEALRRGSDEGEEAA